MKAPAARLLMERYLAEGGATGHLMHLYDNTELTFGELKEVLSSAAEGRLERVTEKLDGMNLVFTWDDGLKVARSGGDIKAGGMDAAALAKKFFGRENIEDAFNGAFQVLNDAMNSLPQKVRERVFKAGQMWYSIEVIYSKNPNVINYDSNWVVFHASPVFRARPDGSVVKQDDAPGVDILEKHVNQMQQALTQRSWQVRGPAVLRLKKLSDGSIIQGIMGRISSAMAAANVGDSDTVGDYLRNLMSEEVADLGLPPKAAAAVVTRCLGIVGAPKLTDIKKMVPADQYQNVNDFVKASPALLKRMILPIETAIHDFAIEALRGLHSVLVSSHEAEVQRLRSEVGKAVKAIEASGDATAMDILQKQMQKLGSLENIAAAMEGVVFIYKGNAYKFTGAFAPANQILGLFKYGRGGKKIPAQEAYLRSAVARLLTNAGYNPNP